MSSGDYGDRYALSTLVALYEYEPTLRDIYVEGRNDARLLQWYFDERGIDVSVFTVGDRVRFSSEELAEIGFDSGARGQVIALAVHAARASGLSQRSLTCVVDADFGRVLGPEPLERKHLLWTDHAAMECYVLANRPLTKLLQVGLGVASVSADEVRAAISPMLLDLYATKAVLYSLDVNWIDSGVRFCDVKRMTGAVHVRGVLERSLNRVAKRERVVNIDEAHEWASVLRTSPGFDQNVGRGHDIAPVLIAYLGLTGPLATPGIVEALMRASFAVEDLVNQPLFGALEARVSA